MKSKVFFVVLIVLLLSKNTWALNSFCGALDLRYLRNNQLETLIQGEDLINQRNIERTQCGLPGENLVICSSCSNETTEQMMSHLRPIVGEKSHLLWHAAWHKLRAAQNLSPEKYLEAQKKNHIPMSLPQDNFTKSHSLKGDLSGEDFFYMHRMMVKMVQLELAAAGLPCMAPWKKLPETIDDKIWPVPKKFKDEESKFKASQELKKFKLQLSALKSENRLKSLSLNRLGQIVEPALHLSLHNFYQGQSLCSKEAKAQGFCDDLVPVETSPLNKYFWKIHGLVDELVGDWLKANNYSEISTDCAGRVGCYQWKGTWVGKYPSARL